MNLRSKKGISKITTSVKEGKRIYVNPPFDRMLQRLEGRKANIEKALEQNTYKPKKKAALRKTLHRLEMQIKLEKGEI